MSERANAPIEKWHMLLVSAGENREYLSWLGAGGIRLAFERPIDDVEATVATAAATTRAAALFPVGLAQMFTPPPPDFSSRTGDVVRHESPAAAGPAPAIADRPDGHSPDRTSPRRF